MVQVLDDYHLKSHQSIFEVMFYPYFKILLYYYINNNYDL